MLGEVVGIKSSDDAFPRRAPKLVGGKFCAVVPGDLRGSPRRSVGKLRLLFAARGVPFGDEVHRSAPLHCPLAGRGRLCYTVLAAPRSRGLWWGLHIRCFGRLVGYAAFLIR